MNRILGILSVGILTFGMLLGFSMLPAAQTMAADGEAAAAAEDGAKKTVKKKKKKVKKAKANAEAEEEAEEDAAPKKKSSKKTKKTKKSKQVKDADADEVKAEEAEEKEAKDADEEKEADAEEAEADVSVDAGILEEEGAEAGEVRKLSINDVEYAFCWCPAGTFQMGAPEDELGYSESEKQHSVKLSKGFWMLQSEVTQEMYESIMGENPSYFSTKGFGKDKGHVSGREETLKFPVDRVSYTDALAFCAKLSEICHVEFKLPTEAQWEYACRAGTSYPFYTDKAPTLQQANYNIGTNSPESTNEVGKQGKNPWNLYDMMGNVDEWCRDYYAPDYYANSPAADPTGPESAENGERVLRGGSFANLAYYLRSASRNYLIEAAKGNRFDGFRFITVPGGEAAPAADADEEKAEDAEAEDADEEKAEDAEAEDADEEKDEDAEAEDADEEKAEDAEAEDADEEKAEDAEAEDADEEKAEDEEE